MSKPSKNQEAGIGRRTFLKSLSGAGALAAAAVGAEQAVAQTAGRESADERRKARYQANSKHVQDFYRTNRY